MPAHFRSVRFERSSSEAEKACREVLASSVAFSKSRLAHHREGSTGISHTRWATHGKPTEANAHPHVSRGRVALVHNGIFENYVELRAEVAAKGHELSSDTDTEALVHLIEDEYDGEYRSNGKSQCT